MKKWLVVLLFSGVSWAAEVSGTITASTCLSIRTDDGAGTVLVSVTGGSWSGTIQPQVQVQDDAATNSQVTPVNSSTPQGTITANGAYTAQVGGARFFQVCGNTVTNTATVKMTSVKLMARADTISAAALTAGLPPYLQTGGTSTAITAPSANATKLWGLVSPTNVTGITTINWTITTTADNNSGAGHNYGIAILDANCTLLKSTGALPGTTFSPSTGLKSATWSGGGSFNITAGAKYYIAWTTDCASACAQLGGNSQGSFLVGGAGATTSGGVPAGTTCAADSYATGNYPGIVLHP